MQCFRRSLLISVAALTLAGLGWPPAVIAASLRGLVTDPDGRPVPRAQVVLSAPVSVLRTTLTDGDGRYRLEGLDAGRYALTVVLPGFRCDPVTVSLGATDTIEVPLALHLAALAESVVVSASQVELPLSRTSDTVTVLTRQDLEARQVETIGDALRMVPGLTVAQSGGRGAITSLLPRGGDSDYTLVLVDGVRVNSFGGGFDLSQLAVADVDRIEVVRGPQSALFGSDAIGAVVQILTRHGGPLAIDAIAEGGSQATSRLAASVSGSRGRWQLGAAIERSASEGFRGIAPATGEQVSNDDWRLMHASASLGWNSQSGFSLRGTSAITATERGYPGPYGTNPIGAYTAVDRQSRGEVTSWRHGVQFTSPPFARGRLRSSAQLSLLDASSDFTSAFGFSESGTRRVGLRTLVDARLGTAAAASIGIDLQREQATSTFVTGSAFQPVPVRRLTAGVFGEVRYQPGSRLSLATGLRTEIIRRDALEASPDAWSPRPDFSEDRLVSVNPKLSLSYLVRQPQPSPDRPRSWSWLSWTRLRGGAGTGIRPPDAFEIAFTDNPRLKPERSRSAELGLEQAFAGDAVRLDITAFVNHYDDLIVAIGPALGDLSRYRTDNISNASSSGIEIAVAGRTMWGLEVRGGYTFLRTRIEAVDGSRSLAPAPFEVGQPLLRRPRHQVSLDLVLTRGRFMAFGQLGGRAAVLDVEPSYGAFGGLFTSPGYLVAAAGCSVRLAASTSLVVRVRNLTDRHYEDTLGFPALGRSVMAGLRIAVRR